MYSITQDYQENCKKEIIQLPGISDENSIKLTKIIEHKGINIDPNINEGYKSFINNFFNKIKICLNIGQGGCLNFKKT